MPVARRFYVLAVASTVALVAASALFVALSARAAVSVFPCRASQLHLRGLAEQGATGSRVYEFVFSNSAAPCVIRGYPKVVLLNQHGHVVSARVAPWIGTHASQITIAHNTRSFFFVRYLAGGFCSTKPIVAYRFKLQAPGTSSAAIFKVVPVNHGPASICRGTLQVSPLRLKATPFAADAAATPICAPSGLRLDKIGGQGFTSHREIAFALRNVTGQTCHLKGYPGVGLLDHNATLLSPTVTRLPGPKPTLVLHTWQRAFFNVVYVVGGPCVPHTITVFGLQVTPPADTGHLVYYLGSTSMCAPPAATVTALSTHPGP